MQGDSWTVPANNPATGTSGGRWQRDSGQRVDKMGLQANFFILPHTPGRVTLSNVSERKDNMRLGLSLATNPKDNSFLVRAIHPTLSSNPSPAAPWTLHLGAGEACGDATCPHTHTLSTRLPVRMLQRVALPPASCLCHSACCFGRGRGTAQAEKRIEPSCAHTVRVGNSFPTSLVIGLLDYS